METHYCTVGLACLEIHEKCFRCDFFPFMYFQCFICLNIIVSSDDIAINKLKFSCMQSQLKPTDIS